MTLREAGIRLTLQGAAEYKAGLKGVSQELRTMSTESKLALAQLGNNASITDTYNTRMKSMSSQLQLSGQRVDMLRGQQEKLNKTYSELPKRVNDVNRAYQDSVKETDRLENNYKQMSKALGENHKETIKAKQAWEESKTTTSGLKTEHKELADELKRTEKELAKLPNEIAKAELAKQNDLNATAKWHEEYRKAGGRLADTAKQYRESGEALQHIGGRIQTAGGLMSGFGSALTKNVTVPLVGLGALALSSAMSWESSFAGVMKTNDEVYDSNGKLVYGYEQLESELRNLAKTIPVAHEELGSIAENAGQLGVATQDVAGFTEVVAKLGHTTNLSYEEASTALAQFLNVTGSGTDTVSNLSSSIVALGNNTAATEKDILMMSQRWATTGAMIGLTDDQIVAFSASLIAMGVNVEAGGSALQRFGQKVNSHVLDAGDGLTLLAETAGMTASEFADAWNNEPATAIEAFLEGLDGVVKEGGNANQLLKDLGITSVNELNALLALAGGHELLADALGLSAKAYEENTALSEEFAVFAETTASKVQVLQNKIKDIAIEFGGPLANALTSALDAAEPWIEKLAEMATAFAEMDEEGQRKILMWAGVAAAAGPVISIFGNMVTGIGGLITGFGTVKTLVADVVQWFGKITTPKALGETVTVMGSLGSVAPIAIAGLGLVAGAYWYLASESGKAYRRMQEFPDISGVTETQAQSLRNLADEVATVGVELDTLNTATDFTNLNSGIQGIGSEIEKLNNDKINKLRDDFKTLPTDVQEALAGALEQTIAGIESQTSRVQEVMDEINRLTQQGLDENGVLQDAYMQHVRNLSDEMMTYYSLSLAENAEQQREIYQHLTADITEMSREQLSQRIQYLNQAREQENALYQQQQDALFAMWQANAISEQEYYARSEQARIAHEARMRSLDEERIRSSAEMFARQKDEIERQGRDFNQAYEAYLRELADQFNMTYEEIQAIVAGTDLTPPVKNMLQYANDATPQLKSAVNQWNTAILDFAYSAGKAVEDLNEQDLQTFIEGIRETGMTWEDLQLLTKEANIDDNLKEFIEAYVEANGGWEALIFAEKQARANVLGMDELQRLVELFGVDFASLTDEQKEAMINANGAKELSDLMVEYGIWKADSPAEAKRAAVDADPALSAFKELFIAQGWWEDATFPGKIADVDTNKEDFMDDLAQIISEWSGIPVDEIKQMLIETNAEDTTRELGTIGGAVEDLNGRQIIIKTREDGSTYIKGDLSTLKQTAEEVDGTTATVYANANGVGESASAMVDFNTQADAMPTEKSSSIKSNVFSTAANTIALLAYNAAVDAMKDKTSTATTQVPRLPADTRSVNDWNQAMRDMFNKTSTATTRTPGLPNNTNLVNNWTSAMRNTFNKTSTLTTRTPNISGNTSSVWSWISALNSAYSTSSTFTTYRRTVYQTVGRAFAEGGHIDMFADGGNVKWGGMFANGGMVPKGFMGIVGEAGPELFHVTESGVSITPLAPGEKMRGVEGAIEDYLKGKGGGKGGSGGDVIFNITFKDPVVRDETDFKRLAKAVKDELTIESNLERIFRKGREA